MNVDEMYTYVYQILNSDTDAHPRTQVLQYLNDAQTDVYHEVVNKHQRFFETVALVGETAGENTYALPAGLFKLLRIMRLKTRSGTVLEDPLELDPMSGDAGEIAAMGREGGAHSAAGFADWLAEGYYLNGTREFVVVPRSITTQAEAFEVRYVYEPRALVEDADVPFTSADGAAQEGLATFQVLLPLKAAAMLAAFEEDGHLETALMRRVQAREAQLNDHLTILNAQAYRHVQEVDDEWGYY